MAAAGAAASSGVADGQLLNVGFGVSVSPAAFGFVAALVGNTVVGVSQCMQKYAVNRGAETDRPRYGPAQCQAARLDAPR